ncbi:hypothetical protein G4B88_018844 [Cannabis sativa]|uniref:Uncharacterized protein n=1 Tax=Cannabis sativa TaxID=3483 RepID=A0A7J6E203_CANSA|nr:hypothetical protein G4B88_018844 [Cannabis sativa]
MITGPFRKMIVGPWTKRRKEEDEDEYEGFELGFGEKMAFLKGEPLIRKLALVSKYAVLPGAMIAALVYSPPDFVYYSNNNPKPSK